MKLYNSLGPNPRLVRMFILEKGIEIPTVEVDLLGGENRRGPYMDKNPAGQLPCLELDDGSILSETAAICEYLEEIHPSPALIGATPEERAETRMWQRRVEFNITEPAGNGFRFGEGLGIFKDRIHVIPEAADGLKAMAQRNLKWLDGLIADRPFVVGNRFTLADIILYSVLDFGTTVGQPISLDVANIHGWLKRVGSRESAEKSLHPSAKAAKLNG